MLRRAILLAVVLFLCLFFIGRCREDAGSAGVLSRIEEHQEKVIAEQEEKITALQAEYDSLSFEITERSGSGISFAVSLAGADDVKQLSIPGKELYFDFYQIPVTGGFCLVPYRVYSDSVAPASGISLLGPEYIGSSGLPPYYKEEDFSEKDLRVVERTVEQLRAGEGVTDRDAYGTVVHDLGEKRFATGTVYRVVVHTGGGITIGE